jgi:predicted enzyme related to lactoylglutathione lyase
MPRVVHFEIPAGDPDRVARFYTDVFDWRIHKIEGPMEYWLVSTGEEGSPGINGGIYRRSPEWGEYVNTIDVRSIDESIAAVEAAGGSIVTPKTAMAGLGWLAYFRDPEGNLFGMMQADETAA